MNTAKPKQGLAITSLVLGVSSVLCLSVLTGVPAIITGHVARGRARRAPGEHSGAGMALAGLILGYASVAILPVMAVLAALLLPALAQAKGKAQTITCVNNLKQVGLAVRIYATDHADKFPSGFGQLPNGVLNPAVLICPADPKRPGLPGVASPAYSSYEWVLEPGAKDDSPQSVVARCPIHGNVVLSDGSVQQGRGQR
jgi:hypothetical protein